MIDTRQYRRFLSRGERFSEAIGKIRRPKVPGLSHRIGIFQNVFLGQPFRAKGFVHRELAVAWSVLAHNLWVLARLPTAEEKKQEMKLAA